MYRNKKAEQQVLSFYESLPGDIRQFPLNIRKAILTLGNCTIYSYQEVVERNNISIDEVIIFCGSDTGCTIKQDDNCIVMFNDAPEMVTERKIFTLAHELAHILLGESEEEANYFAACILCPMPVLSKLNPQTPLSVQKLFGLSREAAEIALKNHAEYDKKHNTKWHNAVLKLFDFQIGLLILYAYKLDRAYTLEPTQKNHIWTVNGNITMEKNEIYYALKGDWLKWEKWDEDFHSDIAQFTRLIAGASPDCVPVGIDGETGVANFYASDGYNQYKTMTARCQCLDFVKRRKPCKHMYRLAMELGFIEIEEEAEKKITRKPF